MSGFNLPENFISSPEALLRKKRTRAVSSSAATPTVEPVNPAPSVSITMAKTLRDYSTPVVANVPVGPVVNTGNGSFELRTGLLTMVQANQFNGLPSEDANAHLQNFLELCDTIIIKDVAPESVKLRLFPFSLSGKAKQWFYQSKEAVNTWDKCSAAFLAKFFPMSKTNALRWKISNFQQTSLESIPEAWERLQEYIRACPHHGMEDWLVLQNFYEGLTPMSKGHVDAAAGGAFLSLTIENATALIEKMVANQSWGEGRKTQKGMHTVKETDLLAAKIELLMKKLDGQATNPTTSTVQAIDSRMTCEECGNVGHMGINCPGTQEDASFINNGFRQQQPGNGWNNQNRPQGNYSNSGSSQPSLKDLVLGQAKINENLVKKLSENDQKFVSISTTLDGLTLSVKNQLAFNEKIEARVAQLAKAAKSVVSPDSVENVKSVTTRGGKTTRDPPYPNHAASRAPRQQEETPAEESVQPTEEPVEEGPTPPAYGDTTLLPFITKERRKKKDGEEQFLRFVEMVEKTHVSVPLMDVLHIPSYSKFIKDIINRKRPLPSTEVVKLTEECSAAILNELPEKKQDPGCPTISCSIGAQQFDHALCDLGASVSVMPKSVFDRLNFTNLEPTTMTLQLADSSVRYPAGIAQDIPVKIRGYYVPVDFVVLNMELTKETPLILGRPFLSTAGAQIDVGAGEIRFNLNGQEEKFEFRPRRQQECNMIRILYGPNPQGIRQVEIQPQQIKNSKISKKPEPKEKAAPKKNKKEQKKKQAPKKNEKKIEKRDEVPKPSQTKQVWRPKKKEEPTPTPPKVIILKWRPKEVQPSTPPKTNAPSSSKN